MNLRNLFRVVAVIGILSGLGYLFAPQAASVMDLDPYGLYFLQQIGASNIAIAVLQGFVEGILNLVAVLGGSIPSGAGWIGAVLNFMIALAFGYFRFIRPETS
jgi:hypothetical protein